MKRITKSIRDRKEKQQHKLVAVEVYDGVKDKKKNGEKSISYADNNESKERGEEEESVSWCL